MLPFVTNSFPRAFSKLLAIALPIPKPIKFAALPITASVNTLLNDKLSLLIRLSVILPKLPPKAPPAPIIAIAPVPPVATVISTARPLIAPETAPPATPAQNPFELNLCPWVRALSPPAIPPIMVPTKAANSPSGSVYFTGLFPA